VLDEFLGGKAQAVAILQTVKLILHVVESDM